MEGDDVVGRQSILLKAVNNFFKEKIDFVLSILARLTLIEALDKSMVEFDDKSEI